MILRWLDNKRKKKGENFESRYQEKLSLYEIVKALLYFCEGVHADYRTIERVSLGKTFFIDVFRFYLNGYVSDTGRSYYKKNEAEYSLRLDIRINDGWYGESIGVIFGQSVLMRTKTDFEKELVVGESTWIEMTEGSPFTEEEMKQYFWKLVKAYREEWKKKVEKDVEKYFQEMQKQKERREEILKEIQKVKNDLLS